MKIYLYQDKEVSEEEFVSILIDRIIFTSCCIEDANKALKLGICLNINKDGKNHRFKIIQKRNDSICQ